MKLKILYFSLLRDVTGTEEELIEVTSESDTVAMILEELFRNHPELRKWDDRLLLALDCEYVNRGDRIGQGSELALMPPVQGG